MAELEHDLARAVGALRSKRSPPSGAKQRIHAAVVARVRPSSPDDGGHGGGESPAVQAKFMAKVVGATATLTAGGLLVVKLAVLAVRSLTPDQAPAPVVDEHVAVEPSRVAVPSAPPIPSTPRSVDPREPELPAAPAQVSASLEHDGPSSNPPTADNTADITAELALIDAARAGPNPNIAIAKLREHADRFPNGMLRDEREALWVIADCEREDFVHARQRAKALAERRPHSPLLNRIDQACPQLEN